MGTARRLYLYAVSLVSLLAFTAGFGSLLQLGFSRLNDALAGNLDLGGGITSGQAALSIAMIAVGLPVWVLHWTLVRRGMRSAAPDAAEDRGSAARAWYLAIVMGVAIASGVAALAAFVAAVGQRLLGLAPDAQWPLPLAVALVALPTWAVHARMRWAEIRTTRLHRVAAWTTRLYRYVALYAFLVYVLANATGLLETVLSVLVGRTEFGSGESWWQLAAIGQASAIAIGAAAWLLHWRDAAGTIRDRDQIGEDDRVSRLRAAFFAGSLLTTSTWVLLGVAGAVAAAGRLLTGMSPASTSAWLEDVVGPPVALLPFAFAAAWLVATARAEAVGVGPLQVLAARRLTALLPSLAGLAFLAVGVVQLLQTVLLRVGATEPETILYGENVNYQVPWYVAQVLVGLALWLPCWASVLRAREREPLIERTAAASRGYLFLVMGAAFVAAVPAAIAILFRILEPMLGGAPSGSVLADVSFAFAVLVVALVAGAYHGRMLLGDLAASAKAEAVPVASPTVADETPAPEGATIELVLDLPAGEDASAVITALAAQLPPGATLRVRPVA